MSYSISVRGKNKHEVKQRAKSSLAAQLGSQAAHQRDAKAAHACVDGMVDAIDEPGEDQEIVVEASGSMTGAWDPTQPATGASINVRAYHAPKATV